MRATIAIKQFMVNQYWITPVIRSPKGVPMNDHWAINGLIFLGYFGIDEVTYATRGSKLCRPT